MHNVCMNQDKTDDLLLDKFDISLLAALQNNAHATNHEVGERIHLSASQVSRRIQRLESLGLEVVLTRQDDAFVSLEDRTRLANRERGQGAIRL